MKYIPIATVMAVTCSLRLMPPILLFGFQQTYKLLE